MITSNFDLFVCFIDAISLIPTFTDDRHAANLTFHGSLDLLNVICFDEKCDWKKKTITLSNLEECQTYNIIAKFSEDCEKPFSINVPISGNYNSLKQNAHYCS